MNKPFSFKIETTRLHDRNGVVFFAEATFNIDYSLYDEVEYIKKASRISEKDAYNKCYEAANTVRGKLVKVHMPKITVRPSGWFTTKSSRKSNVDATVIGRSVLEVFKNKRELAISSSYCRPIFPKVVAYPPIDTIDQRLAVEKPDAPPRPFWKFWR